MILLDNERLETPLVADSSAPNTLVCRTTPRQDESFFGFLIRLTEINRYDSASWILKLANLSPHTFGMAGVFPNCHVDFLSLADLTKSKIEDLCSLVYDRSNNGLITIFGEKVSKYVLAQSHPKICPQCLRHSNHYRKQWDLMLVTCCPIHQNLLIDRCHECGKPIGRRRKSVSSCSCGADWRDANLSQLADSEVALTRLLYERFGLLSAETNAANNPLYSLPLPSVVTGLFLIANNLRRQVDTTGRFFNRARPNQQIHQTLLSAFNVYQSWPDTFYKFLSDYTLRKHRSKSLTGLYVSFGALYKLLYNGRTLPRPLKRLLKGEFENYVLNHWNHGYVKHAKWSKSAKQKPNFVSMVEASHLLSTHPYTIRRLVSEGKLQATVKKKGQMSLFLVSVPSIESLKSARQQYVSLEDASKFLGVSQLNILSLVEGGLLKGAKKPTADNNFMWRFDRVMLKHFLHEVQQTVKQSSPRSEKLKTFRTVLGLISLDIASPSIAIKILIRDILSGLLIPRSAVKSAAISGLRFCRNEVRAYLKKKRKTKKRNEILQAGLNVRSFGLTRPIVYFLSNRGLIKTRLARHQNQIFHVITQKALERFMAEFVLARHLADQLGTSTKFLVTALHSRGISPVSGRSVDGGAAFVFRRNDLADLNLKNLIQELPKKSPAQSRIVNLNEAAQILEVSKREMTELVDNGVVRTHGRCSDLRSPFFYRRTLDRCKRQFSNLSELISTTAAGKFLGLSRNSFFHLWIRTGYLEFEISSDGKQRLLRKAQVKQIGAFLKEAVNEKMAAQLLGVSVDYIHRWRERKWLEPIPNPYPRAFSGHVYSKTVLASLRVNHNPTGIHKKTLLVEA